MGIDTYVALGTLQAQRRLQFVSICRTPVLRCIQECAFVPLDVVMLGAGGLCCVGKLENSYYILICNGAEKDTEEEK